MSAAKTGHRGDHPLRIAVLIKQVPMGEFGVTEDGRLRRAGVAAEINPYCRRALAKGIELARVSNGYCVAIAMGPPEAEAALREAVLCGADDAVLLSDRRLAGADSLATALALAAYIRQQEPFDLVITGLHSVDADTGQVGPQMAELLDLPFIAGVHDLAIDGRSLSMRCEHDDRTVIVTAELPAILSAAERLCAPAKAKIDQWASHSHGARIRVVGADELGAGPWGQAASPTRVRTVRRIDHLRLGLLLNGDPPAQARRLVDELRQRGTLAELARRWAAASVEGALPGAAAAGTRCTPTGPEIVVILEPGRDRLARELLGEAMRLSGLVGGRVVAAAEVSSAVAQFADEALLLRPAARTDLDEEQTAHALTGILASRKVWAVLTGSTSWGRHVAGRLAAALGAGLIGDAVELTVVEQRLMAWKPAFGDTVHAGIDCATLPQMATIRPGALPLAALAAVPAVTTVVEVGTATRVHRAEVAVDGAADLLVSTPVLIGVGSGVDPVDYPLLAPIADLLSAQLVATRKVTDAGWLPRSRQVGLTGRHVAPVLYLAVGMKGSPNHMVGVRNAGTVVAVNIDVSAQVFRAADYGLIGDWRSVVAELTTALSGVYTAGPARVDSAHSSAAPQLTKRSLPVQTELVSVHRDGGLAVLTLNVPERRNVLSTLLVEQIGAAFDGLEADPAMRGVVLTGAGSAFCAGAELSSLWAAAEGDFSQIEAVYDGFLRVLHSPLATIAAINGPAVGAGLNLALACDIRLASERAVFDTRFAQLRIHPGGGHLWMLARAVGQQQAMLACLFGEVWDAPAAAQRGLVAAVHAHDQLLDAAIALGHRLDGQEPVFTRRLVATVRAALGTAQHGEALALEAEAQRWSTTRPAFLAGIEAIRAMIRTRRCESTTTSGPV